MCGETHYRKYTRFFYITLCYETLQNFYETNFFMKKEYNFSIDEIENMHPFEKHIYVIFIERSEKEKRELQERASHGR